MSQATRSSGGRHAAEAIHLDQTSSTSPRGLEARIMTQGGDWLARAPRDVEQRLAFLEGDAVSVEFEGVGHATSRFTRSLR